MAPSLRLAVCGLHLRGYPLHSQLTDLKARFVRVCNSVSTLMCFGSLTALPAPCLQLHCSRDFRTADGMPIRDDLGQQKCASYACDRHSKEVTP